MSAYNALAASYDALTTDVPYPEILRFWQARLLEAGKKPETVLDLACGTGSLSVLLAEQGYRVLASDRSEEMLTEAARKAEKLGENRPFFIRQSMEKTRLPQPVDWIVCCLDSLNYLTDPEDCRKTLRRCWESLNPGGMLTFDVHSVEKMRAMDGQIYLDENDEAFCVWRTEFDGSILFYGLDLFTKEGKLWRREAEEHRQYAYTQEQLEAYLWEAGFRRVQVCADLRTEAPGPGAQRLFFAAEK